MDFRSWIGFSLSLKSRTQVLSFRSRFRNSSCSINVKTGRRSAVLHFAQGSPMHVHANPINPYAQLDALQAAEKAAAKRGAERTRKKLMESASRLAGEAEEAEYCIVELQSREDTEQEPKQQNRQKNLDETKAEEATSSETEATVATGQSDEG